ncbi:hypothetical protein Leryth_026497 [Lithospermum erythrorhizon]|nr:hypothetical protein Leryth_026497 [Lithospermum erythrorhizon]
MKKSKCDVVLKTEYYSCCRKVLSLCFRVYIVLDMDWYVVLTPI